MYDIYHSAKGTSWSKKDHKYIKKENGKYYYRPESYKNEKGDADSTTDEKTEDLSKRSIMPGDTQWYLDKIIAEGPHAGMVRTYSDENRNDYEYPNNIKERRDAQRRANFPTKTGEAYQKTVEKAKSTAKSGAKTTMDTAKAVARAVEKAKDVTVKKDYVGVVNDDGLVQVMSKEEYKEWAKLYKRDTGKNPKTVSTKNLAHSAKGTSWSKKDHKYIKKENGKYFYSVKKTDSKTSEQPSGTVDYEEKFNELAEQIGQDQANQLLRYYKNINLKAVGSTGTKEDYDAALNKAYEDLFRVVGNAKSSTPAQESKTTETTKSESTQQTKQPQSQARTDKSASSKIQTGLEMAKKAQTDLNNPAKKEEIKKKTQEAAVKAGQEAVKYAEQKAKKEVQEYAMEKARQVLAENNKKKQQEKAVKEQVLKASKKLASAAQTKAANDALTNYVAKNGIKDNRTKLQKFIDKGTTAIKQTVKKIADETIIDEVLVLAGITILKRLV